MAIRLKKSACREDVEQLIHYWFDLLAKEDYSEAFYATAHDPEITVDILRSLVKGYGFFYEPGKEPFMVTNWRMARTDGCGCATCKTIRFFDEPRGNGAHVGEVVYTIPLNGLWSDVTAVFRILRDSDSTYLELEDLRVL